MLDKVKSTVELAREAKAAGAELSLASDEKINGALLAMAERIEEAYEEIILANEADMEAAREHLSTAMLDRLKLNRERISGMARGIRKIAELPSPINRVIEKNVRPNGLVIEKISVPIGLIAIIYESRPNVTSDAAALAIKSGNSCILRTGKEAHRSAEAIVRAMKRGLCDAGINESVVALVEDTSRASAMELMTARGIVDLLIPRGGGGLIRACVENATVPCLETGTGICHIFVDRDADIDMALSILDNAKTSRPSVCNAAEVCLVHSDIAKEFLPLMKERLQTRRSHAGLTPVELRLDERAALIIDGIAATNEDFNTEFLDYTLAVKTVDGLNDAIAHIAAYSTKHSEAIITENADTADIFMRSVDSAAVYWNASTRFTDGGEFGLGCEMGISTQKMHARGPLGIEELTTYKYVIHGEGQTR